MFAGEVVPSVRARCKGHLDGEGVSAMVDLVVEEYVPWVSKALCRQARVSASSVARTSPKTKGDGGSIELQRQWNACNNESLGKSSCQ